MTPLILALCVLLIGSILRKETKENGKFPAALWLPFVWIFVSLSRPISTWLSPNRAMMASSLQDYIQGNPTERVFLVGLISLGLFVVVKRKSSFSVPVKSNIWLIALYAFSLVSIGWAEYQGVSIRRWIRAAGDIIMVLIILTEKDPEEAIERILHRLSIILIPLSIVLIRWMRPYGVLYNPHGAPFWAGVTTGKNELGLLCAYLGVFLVWRVIKRWPQRDFWDIAIFLMIFYLLYGAKSSTSDVVLLAGTLLLFILTTLKSDRRRFNTFIVLSIIMVIAIQWLSLSLFRESITPLFFSATGRDATFTGRADLWKELISIGGRHPIGGAGYGNFWIINMKALWEKFAWGPTNAHSGFLDVYLEMGLAGLIILILLIATTYSKVLSSLGTGRNIGKLFVVYFIMILAHNVTETHIFKPTNFLWIMMLLMAMKISPRGKTPDMLDEAGSDVLGMRP